MKTRLAWNLGAGSLAFLALIAGIAVVRIDSNAASARITHSAVPSARAADPPPVIFGAESARNLVRPEELGPPRAPVDEPVVITQTAFNELPSLSQTPADPNSMPRSLSAVQLKERLLACRDLRRELHAAGGAAEHVVAFDNALLAIAIALDAVGRGTDVLGQRVSLKLHHRRQHRFISNGKLYSFECDEFPGFEALRKGANDSRSLPHDEIDATRVPDELIRALDALTDRAIEFLER